MRLKRLAESFHCACGCVDSWCRDEILVAIESKHRRFDSGEHGFGRRAAVENDGGIEFGYFGREFEGCRTSESDTNRSTFPAGLRKLHSVIPRRFVTANSFCRFHA